MLLIPPAVLKMLPKLSRKIIKIFKHKRNVDQCIAQLEIGERKIPIVLLECFGPRKSDKNILGAYSADSDTLFLFRSLVQSYKTIPAGAMSHSHWVEHCFAHEIAHALDKKRLLKTSLKTGEKETKKEIRKYVSQKVEFDAEMASIIGVDIPFLKKNKNWVMVIASYLASCYPHISCWDKPKIAKRFISMLKKEMVKK